MSNDQFIFATDDKDLYDVFYEKKIPFSPELSKFPTLSNINSKADFDFAVHLWKNQIKEKIKNAIMPLPLSLSVYAPEVANLPNSPFSNNQTGYKINSDSNFLNALSDSKYFDYRRNPPLPITFPEIFDKFILESPSSEGKSSFSDNVVHVKNQKPVPINIYAQDEQKWGSILIPQEPSPDLFDSYESYKKSLKNWASLQNRKISLIHPSEFISSIGIIHNENYNYKRSNKLCLLHEKGTECKPKIFEANSSYNQKVFNPNEFLNMKTKNTPPSPLLIQLFSLTYKNYKNTNSLSTIKYSNSDFSETINLKNTLPFKVPYTIDALLNKVDEFVNSNSESSRVIHLLKSYKNVADPFIDKTVISDTKSTKMTLFTDFSANQTNAVLRQLTPTQTDELTSSFPFYLHQLHIVRSNRIRCRFFIIISNILEKKPKLISTFLADVQTLSNVASLIASFSFLDTRIYTYQENTYEESDDKSPSESPAKSDTNSVSKTATNTPTKTLTNSTAKENTNSPSRSIPDSQSKTDVKTSTSKRKVTNFECTPHPNESSVMRRKSSFSVRKPPLTVSTTPLKPSDVKKTVENLSFFLFVSQLLKVITAFVEKYQPKNRNLLLQINAQTMTFSRFIDMSLTEKLNEIEVAFKNPTPQICVIFHFLCDYDPVSLSKLFQTNLFYIFLGKVSLSSSCSSFFGEMCGHILRLPKLRRLFFLQFFHLHCFLSSKAVMTTIVPTCNFLASLIKLESDCEHDITIDEIFTSFTNVTQLVLFSPSSSLNLIGAIVQLFLKMKPKVLTSSSVGSGCSMTSNSIQPNVASNTSNASNNNNNNNAASNASNNSGSSNLNGPTSSLASSIGGVMNNVNASIIASNTTNCVSQSSNVSVTPAVSLNFDLSNKTFAHIRESILTLFRDPNLKNGHIVTLYNLMNMMLTPYRNDTKSFIERYLSTVVFNSMKSTDEAVCVASWDVFREIFFDSNFQFLRDSQNLKASLSLIVSSKRNLTPPVLIEILFLALGVSVKSFSFSSSMNAKEALKKKKSRRPINLFDQPEGFVIPGINPREVYVEVLRYAKEGRLQDFKNEVETLKIMMPNFKWKKRTISYA